MVKSIKQIVFLAATLLVYGRTVVAMDNVGRYFPFSLRPEKSWYKKESTLDVDLFYASGHNIANEDAAAIGYGEVMGRYDLQHVIFAMDQANVSTQKIRQIIGAQFANSPLLFNVSGKMRSGGMAFNYAWKLPIKTPMPLSVGISVPFIYTESDFRYSLDLGNFNQQYNRTAPTLPFAPPPILDVTTWSSYQESIDAARRAAHDAMGIASNHWDGPGIGDIKMFSRCNIVIDHRFLMRTLDFAFEFGVVVPTGAQRLSSIAPSIPLSNDGHWSFYGQFVPTFELKQDIKIGGMLRGQHFLAQTKDRRISVYQESNLFSPLVGAVRVQPGTTLIAGAFLALENLYDGLHLQGRYTYKAHYADRWTDARTDKTTVPSYLSRTPTAANGTQAAITKENIDTVIAVKEYLSKFRSHYITIQLTYDPLEAQHELPLRPKFYASFEAPFFDASKGVVQANQISIGAELHF